MIAAAVVAHTRRLERAQRLATHLGGAEIFLDDGSLGEWANHERALRWAYAGGDHALIVQDDALLIPTFASCVQRLVDQAPNDMIGLYVGRQRPRARQVTEAVAAADQAGAGWLTTDRLLWGVATLFRSNVIPELLEYPSSESYDIRLGKAWVHVTGRPVLYCWPSIVDHDDELPSLIAGREQRPAGRVAHRVGEPNTSPASVWISR
jgi:hypothetical protein